MIAPLRSETRLSEVLRSLVGSDGYRQRLEQELAELFGVPRVLATHSGRTGLYFLLKALPQERVYLTAYTCRAVVEAVLRAGKKPVYVDISLDDYNMDLGRLAEVLQPVSIILATHQFGIPCDIESILTLARERDCTVLEDAAPALGVRINGRLAGSFGRAAILSFDYSKAVSAGKGGAILCNDEGLYRAVREMMERETAPPGFFRSLACMLRGLAYVYGTHPGIYRLIYTIFKRVRGNSMSTTEPDLSPDNDSYRLACDHRRARLVWLGLRRLETTLDRRREITADYLTQLAGNDHLLLPKLMPGSAPPLLKLPLRLKEGSRDAFYRHCLSKGIDLAYLFPLYCGNAPDSFPNAAVAATEGMALPISSALREGDIRKITEALREQNNSPPAPGLIAPLPFETRRLLCFSLHYYFSTEEFLRSQHRIALLRSHDRLPESEYQLKFCYKTFLIDLHKPIDEIFAAFDKKAARSKIRRALDHNVIITRAETAEAKQRFYDFYQDFVQDPKRKNKILVVQEEELHELEIFNAETADGEYLGGSAHLASPDGKYYYSKYSATSHRFFEQELLIWHAIQFAKEQGHYYFDLSWMSPDNDRNSDQHRLFQFKKKFGGELVDCYCYVKFRGGLKLLGYIFGGILKLFFKNDVNQVALLLKKTGFFK